MTRWIVTTALASTVALGLAAGAAFAQGRNVLRWSSQGDALTIDPHAQNHGPTNSMNLQIHDPLVRLDKDMKMQPGLAVSWRVVNPTTWEFKLRPNVVFHDGGKFTADDVVFTLNRALSPTSDMRNSIDYMAEIKKIDDLTVHIVTKAPNPIVPITLNQISIMSKAWAEKNKVEKPQDFKNKEETFAVRNANGTGPFRLTKRDPGVETVMVRNEKWWGWKTPSGPGNVDEIVYKPVGNAATRVAALLSGEIDFLLDPSIQDLERIKNDAKLKVLEIAQDRTIFLGMEQSRNELRSSDVKGKNPFADKRVRQAVNMSIDREAIRRVTMRSFSAPANIITAPAIHGYSKALDTPPKVDVEGAKKLMAAAGYANGFEVKLDCPNNRYINDEQICTAIVAMLARIGIKVKLDAQTMALHTPKLQKRESDFYLLGWGVPTFDSHYVFNFLLSSKGTWNAGSYKNDKVDALTLVMSGETDLKKRDAAIAEAWKIVADDVAYVALHHQLLAWGLKKTIDFPIAMNDQPQFRYAVMKK
jgi:peptide/nickel transport system substrate-binding protein